MAARATLTEIAAAAGVSLATVDRVINQRGGVRADKEARIIAAARGLGWERSLDRPPTATARVAVLIQSRANPFHAALHDGIELARKAYAGLGLQLLIRHIDPNAPARTAARITALDGQCEGLIISAPDTPVIAHALAGLGARVPVITLATDIAGSGRTAYVGPDDERSGRVAADLMGRFIGQAGGEILMVAGRMDLAGQAARARGFGEGLRRHFPACRLLRIVETGENADAVIRQVREVLATTPGLRGIYHVSVGAAGIVAALDESGRAGGITLISHELTPNRRALLRDRRIDAVIDQMPHEEARLAVETMARALGRLDGAPGSISTDIRIFTPENA